MFAGFLTDPQARGQVVGVARGQHARHRPVAALGAWIVARGSRPGVVFTSMRGGHGSLDPISGNAIARMLKTRAQAAGLSTDRLTAHSLRAGHATTAALLARASCGSPPRPGTAASRPSSSTTSGPWKHSRCPPAATSASEPRSGSVRERGREP